MSGLRRGVCTARELDIALMRYGFTPMRQTGSHVVYGRTSGGQVAVPKHKGRDLRDGTLANIIRQVERVTGEDFEPCNGKRRGPPRRQGDAHRGLGLCGGVPKG